MNHEIHEKKSKGLVPGLRFPEFRDAGEWEERQLSHLTTKISDGIHTTPVYDKNGEYAFINGNNLVHGRILIDEKTKRVNFGEFNKHKKPLDENSILMSINGTIGNLAFFRGEQVILGKSACFIKIDSRLANKFFIYNMLQTEKVKHLFTSELTGSTIKNLSLATIKNIALRVPTLPEQQKIADCLSSLDEIITTQAQKIDTLKAHKKGLMQELFPAEGETVPGLRFPEFRDAGEWEEKKLIDVADKKTKWSFIGGPFGSNLKSSDYVADGVRIIQLQNIGDAEFVDDYKIFTSEEKADELLANNIYPGEIILSKMGDPVGRACLIPYKHARYVMCSDGIRLVVDEKAYSKYFIYTLINSIQFRALVEKTATGSTRKRIGLSDLKNLPMVVPKPEEQQKIADCISSLDELIIAEAQKLDTLKAHKTGLMQGLFPSTDEVHA